MKIITFNLRCENPRDGMNCFSNRRGLIIDRLRGAMPDVMGLQEIKPGMNEYLIHNLPEYTFVGCGRGADYQDEHNPVAFRRDKYELIGLDVTWLSATPHVPGSRFPVQSPCPRIVTHVILRPLGGGAPFHFYNTHLDHESSAARVQGAGQLLDRIRADQKTHPFPILVTGDFNAEPDKPEIAMMTADEPGLADFTDGVGTTYHGWGRETGPRIDYIFARGFVAEGPAERWMEHWENLYLSDHYAVSVAVRREDGGLL